MLATLAMSVGWAGLPPPTDAVLYVSATDAATFSCSLHVSLAQPKAVALPAAPESWIAADPGPLLAVQPPAAALAVGDDFAVAQGYDREDDTPASAADGRLPQRIGAP